MSTKLKMESSTIQELLEDEEKELFIPNYQRAYTWKEDQLKQWVTDLQEIQESPDPQYYLGRILLEKTDDGYAIIDGQQRLTTVLIFLNATDKDRFDHYFDNFSLGDADDDFFHETIRNGEKPKAKTAAQHRIKAAKEYFENKTNTDLCETLLGASIAIITVKDKRTATLMFQLENDRGVNLTNMEKLKAYLMYEIQLCAESSEKKLAKVAEYFDEIGLISDQLRESPEKILEAHYQSFITPDDSPYRDYSLDNMKEYFYEKEDKNKRVSAIIEFCEELTSSFKNTQILEGKIISEYSDTFRYLKAPDYVWPFILCEMKQRSSNHEKLKVLLKVLAELVLRHELVRFHEGARGTNISSYQRLGWMLEKYRSEHDPDLLSTNLSQVFEGTYEKLEYNWRIKGARGKNALAWSQDKYVRCIEKNGYKGFFPYIVQMFFLYQYEVSLQEERVDLDEEWTLEHISPQSKRERKQDSSGYAESDTEANELIEEGYIEWIGNLCLLEKSLNSKASNKSFTQKLEIYSESTLAQAKEIEEFATEDKKGNKLWATEAINERGDKLIEFIVEYYKPGECTNRLTMF